MKTAETLLEKHWLTLDKIPGVTCRVIMLFKETSILGGHHVCTGYYDHEWTRFVTDRDEYAGLNVIGFIPFYL